MTVSHFKIENKLVRAITVAIIASLLAVFAARSIPMIRLVDNFLYDLRIHYASAPVQAPSDIVIVAITEQTLASFPYRTPVDRQFLNDLLLDLETKGVKSISFDLLFDQPTEPDKDRRLRDTLNRLEMPIVFVSAGLEDSLLPAQQQYLDQFTNGFAKGTAGVFRDANDSVVRAAPIWFADRDSGRTGFAAAIAQALGIDLPDVTRLLIDYKQPADVEKPLYVIYPAHTVSLLPESWFAGKNILVGVALGFEDRLETPLSRFASDDSQVAGIEIHAQLLAQLQDRRFIRQPGLGSDIALSALVGLLTLACFSGRLIGQSGAGQSGAGQSGAGQSGGQKKTSRPLLFVSSLLILIWVSSLLLFYHASLMIALLPPSITLGLVSAFSILQKWREEKAQRQFIQGAFSKYLSHDYVDQLIANPDQLKVSGEKREITFLFTDLAGFTGLTERLEPEAMMTLINQYLEGACDIVIRHGGMVASIVGDALHVMFNAPMLQPDHAQRAINAAIELDAFCRNFELMQQSKGIHIEMTRIGINTGPSILGNYGGGDRIEYTAMGEAINTAARLESVNKHIGTRICISDSARQQSTGITFRPVACLILKGMTREINAFEPIDRDDPNLADYDRYLEAYRKIENKEADALTELQNLYRDFSNDPLVSFHLRRLESGETGTTIVMMDK